MAAMKGGGYIEGHAERKLVKDKVSTPNYPRLLVMVEALQRSRS